MRMTADQQHRLVAHGAVVLPGVVPDTLCVAALSAIEEGGADLGSGPAVQALYHSSGLAEMFSQLLGETKPVHGAQIAIRQPVPPEATGRYLDGDDPSTCT
jgi:hypothetical protein